MAASFIECLLTGDFHELEFSICGNNGGLVILPPLKTLQVKDLEHLDAIPLSEEEQHGHTGRNKERRRPTRKIFFDMTYLMTYITTKVTENGGIPLVITDSAVVRMFELVGGVFLGGRNAQKRWSTVSNEVQKRAREHRQAIAA